MLYYTYFLRREINHEENNDTIVWLCAGSENSHSKTINTIFVKCLKTATRDNFDNFAGNFATGNV